jgi:hypothetical protein
LQPGLSGEIPRVFSAPGLFRAAPRRRSVPLPLYGILAVSLFLAPEPGRAQGGPPLVTDDPGTPGSRHWEVNIAFTFEKRGSERTFGTPLLDANYGLGDRIQLKIEMPWIVRRNEAGSRSNGSGNVLFGVKWRFLDEETRGVAVSTYPQIEVNASRSSARKGLVDEEPGLLLPLSFQKAIGPISANLELGHAFRRGQKDRWIYGLALGHDVSKDLEVVGEVFGGASARFTDIGLDWNLGARWKLARHLVLLASAGAGISRTAEEPRTRFQSYFGVQLIF